MNSVYGYYGGMGVIFPGFSTTVKNIHTNEIGTIVEYKVQGPVMNSQQQQSGMQQAWAGQSQQQTQWEVQAALLRQQQGMAGVGALHQQLTQSYTSSINAQSQKGGIMSYLKGYFLKHRELLMGLGLALVLDHFLLDGALQEKIKKLIHSILDKAEKKFTDEAV